MENKDESKLRKIIEETFYENLSSGVDISCYLYLPEGLMSDNIKRSLDDFLVEKAYEKVEAGSLSKESFIVYSDDTLRVKMTDPQKQMELLERMLEFYLKKEEYEKCSNIQTLIEKLK